MWKPTLFFAKAIVVAAVVLMLTPQESFAQKGRGGGGAGGVRGGAIHSGGAIQGGGAFHGGAIHNGPIRGGVYHNGNHNNGAFYGGLALGLGLGYYGYPNGYGYSSNYYDQPYYYAQPYPYYQAAPLFMPDANYSNYPPPNPMANTALVDVRVPPDAQLWFDGAQTTQQGADRSFVTPPLTPGTTFTYEIRATWMINGTPVTQTRQVQVEAGKRATVNFLEGGVKI